MLPSSPQYDIIAFYSGDDVQQTLKWFDRLYNYILDQIGMLEAALNAIKAAEDQDPYISEELGYGDNRKDDPDTVEGVHPVFGPPPELLVFSGFHTENPTSIPNPRQFLDELLAQRIRMLEVVFGGRKKIQGLEASISIGGRPVILIWESIWYIFGTRYFFAPQDAQEYFCLKGECSQQAYPFLWHDPYFDHIEGLSFGDPVIRT